MGTPTNPLAAIAQFIDIAKTAPPVPMLVNGLARLLTQAVVDEAVRVGPTSGYLLRMKTEGFSETKARAFYAWVMEDALLRDDVGAQTPRRIEVPV
jgi:hypothetical protein